MWNIDGSKGEELHDYSVDPGELHNLAGDPVHAAIAAELRNMIRKNWAHPYLPT
jgi:hypothetical protein